MNKKAIDNSTTSAAVPPIVKEENAPFVKKIGKAVYRVRVHISTAGRETMSNKIKRILRNEINRM